MRSRNGDLVAAGVWAVAAAAAALAAAPVPLTAILGVPAVLLVPGYVWADVALGSQRVSGLLRLAVIGALSLAIAALVPIAVGLAGLGLSRAVLVTVPAAAAVVGAVVAAARRDARDDPAPRRRNVRRPSAFGVALGCAVGSLVAAAAAVTWSSATSAQGNPGLRLWLDPAVTADGTLTAVLANDGTARQRYEIEVRVGGLLWSTSEAELPAGATWQENVPVDMGSPIAVAVRDTATGTPLRQVSVVAPPLPSS